MTKQSHLAWPLGVFLIILMLSLLVVKPKVTQIFAARKKIVTQRAALAQLTQKVVTLESLDGVELTEKVELSLKVLPTEKDVPLVLWIIKQIGQGAGVKVNKIETDPGKISAESAQVKKDKGEEKDKEAIDYEVMLEGDLAGAKSFLAQVATSSPLMDIPEVSLTGKEGANEIKIKLRSIFLPLPKTIGKIDSLVALLTNDEKKTYDNLSLLKFYEEDSLPAVASGKENPFAF